MSAQLAKDYAAAHGFTIEYVGRRLKATRTATGRSEEAGGYEALLNRMKLHMNGVAHGTFLADPIVSEPEPAAIYTNDDLDPFLARNMVRVREEIGTNLAKSDTVKTATGLKLDVIGAAFNKDARKKGETDLSYRYYLKYGRRPEQDLVHFKPKVPSMRIVTHHVVLYYVDSKRNKAEPVYSYADAVKMVRRALSGPDCKSIVKAVIY